MGPVDRAFRARKVVAFTSVYLIWGSTYLAIRFAIESLPCFSMAGFRFLLAGLVLYLGARMRGAAPPTLRQWGAAAVVGGLLLLGGNGGVVWAEQRLPSGLAALLVGTEPLWVVVLLWLSPGGGRPNRGTVWGLVIGFLGAAILAAPSSLVGGGNVHFLSACAVLLASVSWAAGSLYARHADLPTPPAVGTAAQMISGGALLLLAGVAGGELAGFEPAAVTRASLLGLAYLIVFGSLVAFSAYSWLVRTTAPTLVATYAYVNPVVAVFLGWLLAGEPLGWKTAVATVLIVGSVVLVSVAHRGQWGTPVGRPEEPGEAPPGTSRSQCA